MKNTLEKMKDYLPHLSFFLIGFGAFLTFLGGYTQFRKDKKSDQEAAERDRVTIQNHIDLQTRSNDLLDSTEKVLDDTKRLLDSNSQVLSDTRILIRGSDALQSKSNGILNDTKVLLEGSNEIIEQNIKALKHLDGSDLAPRLVLKVSDIFSVSLYLVTFSLENPDDYPIKEIEVKVENDYQLRNFNIDKLVGGFDDHSTPSTVNDILERYNKRQENGPTFLLSAHNTKVIHESILLFKERNFGCQIRVKWGKGEYQGVINMQLDDELHPKMERSYIMTTPAVLGIGSHPSEGSDQYFRFDNEIRNTERTLEMIKRRKE